jgi:hypothetical protein
MVVIEHRIDPGYENEIEV